MSNNQTIGGMPSKCGACGGTSLTWFASNENRSGVPEGRLRTHEVSSVFVLGCDDCSETLRVVGADKMASLLNKQAAQPQDGPLSELEVLRAAVRELEAMRDARVDAKLAQHQGQSVAFDFESAAQKIACCMDYPWEHMPEKGRDSMREHAKAIINAALSGKAEQPAPVAVVHTMQSVMQAIENLIGFPMLTSNQCAALARRLNADANGKARDV